VRYGAAILAVVAALLLASTCQRHPASPRKQTIARLPPKVLAGSVTVSRDLAHHAFLLEDEDGIRMIRDGVPSDAYQSATNRSYAPASALHAYWARTADGTSLLVVGDQAVPIEYSRHEYVVFDSTGRHWAAVATPPGADGSTAAVLRDGRSSGPFADAGIPAWSPAGTLAYLRATDAPDDARRVALVEDDRVVDEHPATAPSCTPALAEALQGPTLPRLSAVRYLSDGRLLVIRPDADHWIVRRGDDTLATYDASAPTSPSSVGPFMLAEPGACQHGTLVAANSLAVADAAPVAAWWERTADANWRVVVDGRPVAGVRCLRPWHHQAPLLSHDGRTVAFPCVTKFDEHGEAIVVVRGSERYGPYPEVWGLALSDDGTRVAYGASDGSLEASFAIFANGVQQSDRGYATWRPRFDPSGAHLGWEVMRTAKGPNQLVLDGRALATFDDLLDGPLFDRPGEVAWLVRRKDRVVRLNFALARD
jgi:hypothetical protein